MAEQEDLMGHAATAARKDSGFVSASSSETLPPGAPLGLDPLFRGTDILLALAIAMVIAAAYFPVMQGLVGGSSDYSAHASFAQRLSEEGVLISPACLLHILIAALVKLGLAASYKSALLGVVVCSHASVGAVLYLSARWAFGAESGIAGRLVPALIAVLGPFVQPPVRLNTMYSIGYLWAEPYHSPTYALLKPFALASAAFAAYFLVASGKPSRKAIAICAIAVAMGTLAKPSFAICALPTVVLCSAYQYARKAPFSVLGVLYGWLLPSLSVLGAQFYRTYALPGTAIRYGDSIVFAPLAAMRIHTSDLAAPYFWSALLPLTVLAIYRKRAWGDSGFRFALIAFLFGTAYTYTLAEQDRLGAANFLWSGYITLFVVYVFAVVFVLRQITSQSQTVATMIRAVPCLGILAWQLTSGFSVHIKYLRLYP